MQSVPTIFISYSSMDRVFARQLADDLSAAKIEVWIDERQVDGGDALSDVLVAGVLRADFVVVILSKHAARSAWVQPELNAALERELRAASTIILPVRIDEHQMPSVLSDRVFADFRGDYGSALSSLVKTFHDLLKSPWCAYVLVTVLDSSNTRMIALCESDHEQYFAYATALRTASGPVYQIGPYGSRSLIRSKPSWSSRGRIS